jgi:DNA-binding NarL/FixJ family response regulator
MGRNIDSTNGDERMNNLDYMVANDLRRASEGAITSQALTPRELDALRLIARGLSNQEIATALFLQERTIAKYVSSILNKLHVSNRTQAALYAIREGLAGTGAD